MALLVAPDLYAQTNYWWDSNDSAAGFGNAQGTWAAPTTNNATQGWTIDNTGSTTMSGSTTTADDNINFGTSTNQLGTGTITVSGNVSARLINFTGSSSNITLSGGNITLGTSSAITVTNSANTSAITETISSNITLGASPTWTVNNGGTVGTATLNVSGNVTGGSYGLTKSGNGTLTLSGAANTWNGTTTVSAGTLTLSGSLTTNGSVSVSSNSTLNVTGNLTKLTAGTFQLGQTSGQTDTINVSGSGILNAGAGMTLGNTGSAVGRGILNITGGAVNTGGTIELSGANSTLNISGGSLNSAAAQIFDLGGRTGSSATLTINGTGSVTTTWLRLGQSGGAGTTGVINLGDGNVGGNLIVNNDIAIKNGSALTMNLNGGTLTTSTAWGLGGTLVVKSGGAIFNVTGNTLTISSNLTDGTGGGGLTKSGAGNLALSGSGNTYTGATTVNAGTLEVAASGLLGGGSYSGNLAINGASSTFLYNGTTNQTLSGVITGNGAFTKSNTSTLTLSGNNNHSGTVTVSAGTLTLGVSQTLGAITGAGALNLSSHTLTTNASSNSTYSGVISGTGALTKNGSSTLTLSNANTYSGGTTINAGTLTTSTATGLGNGTVAVNGGALTINYGAASFIFTNNLTGNGTVNLTAANAGSLTCPVFKPVSMSGFNGTVTMDTGFNNIYYQLCVNSGSTFDGSSAKWVVNNQNANSFVFTDASLVKFGELSGNGKVGAKNSAGSTLEVGALGTNSTFSGILMDNSFGGTLAFIKVGNGTLTLSGNNTYTGATTINAGTLEIGGAGRLGGGSYAGAITNNGTLLSLGSNSNQTLSGAISGTGALTKNGSSTLTLSNTNTYTGGTTINTGTIILSGANAMQTSATVNSGATLQTNRDDAIQDATAITLNGGTLALQTYNDYIGNLTLSNNAAVTGTGTGTQNLITNGVANSLISTNGTGNAGTISSRISLTSQWGAATGDRTQQILVGDNASLTISGVIQNSAPNSAAYTGSILKSGNGTLTLSNAANTYNGTTTISAGTLSVTGSTASSATTVANGGTLTGTGTVGAITLNTGGVIGAGTGTATVGKLTASSLSIGSSSGYAFTIGNVNTSVAGSDYDQISLSGALTFSNTTANPFTVYLYGTPTGWSNTGIYSWDLITGASSMDDFAAGNFAADFANFGIALGSRNGTWSFSSPTTGTIRLTYSGSAGTSTWNTATGSWNTAAQWSENAIPVNNNSLLFTGSGGTSTNNISNSTLTSVNNITFETGAGSYTLAASAGSAGASGGTAIAVAGAITNNSTSLQTLNTAISLAGTSIINAASGNITIGGIISGAGGITKSGANSLTLSTANTYSGGTALNAGTLNIGNATAIGTGTLTITSGTLDNTSGAAMTLSNNNAQNWNGNFTVAGTNDLNMGTGNVTLGATPTVTVSAGNLTVGGVISGSGRGLTKAGSGTMILTGNNTYTGTTTISAGTLQVGGSNGNIAGAIVNNANLLYTSSAFGIYGVTGSGNLTINQSSGTVFLQGNITQSGTVNITTSTATARSGMIQTALGTWTTNRMNTSITASAITINGMIGAEVDNTRILTLDTSASNGAITLDLQNGSSGIWNPVSIIANAGTGNFTLSGSKAGTANVPWTPDNGNSFTGALNISSSFTSGNLTLNATGNSSVTGNLNFQNGSNAPRLTAIVNSGVSMTISGNITQTAGNVTALTKNGTGTLILSGANNTYTGATTVNAGTLQLSGNISSSALTLNSGGIISVGTNTTIAKYNTSSITIGAGTGYIFTIGSNASGTTAGTDFDQLTATGALTFNNTAASRFTVYVNGSPTNWSNTGNYTWNIMSGASISGFNSGNFAVNTSSFGIASGNRTGTWSFATSGGNLTLSYTLATPDYFWDGGTGNWTDTYSAGVRGFTPANPTVDDNLYFSGSGGTVTNNMANSTISSVNFITFNSTAGAYTLAANATVPAAGTNSTIPLTVKGDITNNSNNTQTISMSLAFDASSSGVINTAAGNITISGSISGSTGITKNGNGSLTLSGAKTNTGNFTINAGNVTINGAALNTNITVNSGATLIAGDNYMICNGGSAILTINGGTFKAGNAATYIDGGLVLNNATITNTVGAGTYISSRLGPWTANGNNTINMNISTETNNTNGSIFNIQSGTTTINNSIYNYAGWYQGLTKNGTGTLVLNGANSYNGTTNLRDGTLVLNHNTALGSGSLSALTIISGTLDVTSGTTITLTNNYTQSWNGDFAFLGTNGSLNVGTGAVTMNASRTVTVSNSTFTVGGAIGGSTFGLTKNGSGTLVLSGASTYNGTTTVNAGTITLGAADRIADTSNLNVAGGTFNLGGFNETLGSIAGSGNITLGAGTLTTNSSSNTTFSGIISGTGGLTKNGSSTLTLTGNNTYNGTTTINTGTLLISSAGQLGGGNYSGNISNTGTFRYNSTANQTLGGIISGNGALVKNAASTLTLSGNNTYTGTTTITGGTLQITSTGLLGGGNYSANISNDGTLLIASNSNQTLGGVISGSGAFTKNGTGVLTLSGNNTYSGATTVNAGTLQLGANQNLGVITGAGALDLSSFTLTTNTSSSSTFSGIISGTGAFTKNGTGTLTLAGNNTYSGVTTINTGAFEITTTGRLGGGSYSGNITNNGTLIYSGTNAQTLSGIISGTGALTQNNSSSTLTLSGNNTYTGGTTINVGTISISAAGRLGAGTYAQNITNNGTLIYSGTNAQTLSGVISGTGALTQNNSSSTLTLSGNNTYTGGTTINVGTIEIAATGLLGGGNYSGNITNNGALIAGSNSNQTLGGIISGTGGLTKNGSGTLTLTNTNTYSGATTINTGTLVLNGSAANSTITVASGATLMGSGSAAGAIVSGTVAPGNSPGTLSFGALTLNSGGVYTWEMADATGVAGTGWDRIATSGLLTINSTSGSTFTIAITSSGAPTNWTGNSTQSWDIFTYGSLSGFDSTKFTINATAFSGFTANGSSWAIADTGSALRLTYTATSGPPIWDGGTGNWGDAYNSSVTGFSSSLAGGNVSVFFTGAGGAVTNNRTVADVPSLASITFNSTAGAYTLAANSGSAGYNATSALELLGNIVNNSTATQTINLALTSNATRTYDAAAGNITIGGVISGTGGVTKNGSNTLSLTAVNTYSGDTTINAGTLAISGAGQLGSGNYSANIINAGTFNYASSANQTLGGTISGNGALTQSGASNLTLTGVNTYTGATTITAGTLTIGGAGQLGSGNYSGNIVNNGILAYNSSANQTLGGTISGTGDLIKNGNSTLTLSHANTYNGTTTVNAGTLSVTAANALGATTEVTIDGGSLLVAASNAINDAADITMGNNGTLVLSGSVGEVVGQFSLTTNSTAIIDMGYTASWISFWKFTSQLSDDTKLWIYNYTVGSDHVYIRDDTNQNVANSLPNITFYSGFGSGFLGSGFFDAPEVHPHIVPEPGTYATAALLLIGLGIHAYRRRQAKWNENLENKKSVGNCGLAATMPLGKGS